MAIHNTLYQRDLVAVVGEDMDVQSKKNILKAGPGLCVMSVADHDCIKSILSRLCILLQQDACVNTYMQGDIYTYIHAFAQQHGGSFW